MPDAQLDQIKRFGSDLELCTKCGYCTFWCPIYEELPVESSVARGKNVMISALLAGEVHFSKEFSKLLNMCTLCMACVEHCPMGSQVTSVIVAARADKVKAKGVSFIDKLIYQWLLPRRILFGNTVRFFSRFQNIFLPKSQGAIRHLPLFLSALGKGRHIPSIAPKFFRQLVPVVNRPPKRVKIKMRVGYFIGCATDFVFPDLGKKIIDFLGRQGVEVVVPPGQGCCGAPVWLGLGDFDTGRKLADANVEAFTDLDYVVSDCATCTSALKDYLKFLADTPERIAAYTEFIEKVKDISQFLVDVLQLPESSYQPSPEVKGKKVTWHDPCHLCRYLGVKEQPRQIIKALPSVEYVEMVRADWCCGMAGAFSVSHYNLSRKIADKKMETIKDTGADIVVTGCPGCEIQLIDNTIRHKMPVKVMHLMELLDT